MLAKNLNSGLKIRLNFVERTDPRKILIVRHILDMELVSTFSSILNERELSLMPLIGSLSGQMERAPSINESSCSVRRARLKRYKCSFSSFAADNGFPSKKDALS